MLRTHSRRLTANDCIHCVACKINRKSSEGIWHTQFVVRNFRQIEGTIRCAKLIARKIHRMWPQIVNASLELCHYATKDSVALVLCLRVDDFGAAELTLGLLGPKSWINCSNEGTRSPLVYRRKSCCRANRVEHKARRVVFRCRRAAASTPIRHYYNL